MGGGVRFILIMKILETRIKEQPEREVFFIHAAQSGKVHAMKDRVKEITEAHPQVTAYTVYDSPGAEDEGVYDKDGYIDEAWLRSVLPTSDANVYFCGPKGFMRAMYQHLMKLNVAAEDIRYEVFGPETGITA